MIVRVDRLKVSFGDLARTSQLTDVNFVLSITFVVGRTTRKSSSKSFYVSFTPLLRLQLTGCLL